MHKISKYIDFFLVKYAKDMHEICQKYARNMPKYAYYMELYAINMLLYAPNMHQICKCTVSVKNAKDMHGICQKYARNMQLI